MMKYSKILLKSILAPQQQQYTTVGPTRGSNKAPGIPEALQLKVNIYEEDMKPPLSEQPQLRRAE